LQVSRWEIAFAKPKHTFLGCKKGGLRLSLQKGGLAWPLHCALDCALCTGP